MVRRKDKIYYYLIHGYAPVKVAKLTKCTKAYVSKVIRQLKKEGYIEEILKDGHPTKPKLFDKTTKSYPSKLTEYSSGIPISLEQQPRLNLIALKFTIEEMPKVKIPGKPFIAGNTLFIDYSKLFKEGNVTFRLISNKLLVVFMPETVVSLEQIRHTKQAFYKKAEEYANWFQKKFHCKLGDGELYQDYHIAIQESDPFLTEMAKKYGMLKVLDAKGNIIAWWDFSKGPCEFETRDERIAENKVFAPIISMNLQDRVYHLESEIAALDLSLGALQSTIDDILTKISNLNDMFSQKPKPPDDNVGYV